MPLLMMHRGRAENISQDLLFELAIDSGSAPAGRVGKWRSRRREMLVCDFTCWGIHCIIPRVHYCSTIVVADGRVGTSRTIWWAEQAEWNNVSVLIQYNLGSFTEFLRLTDLPLFALGWVPCLGGSCFKFSTWLVCGAYSLMQPVFQTVACFAQRFWALRKRDVQNANVPIREATTRQLRLHTDSAELAGSHFRRWAMQDLMMGEYY